MNIPFEDGEEYVERKFADLTLTQEVVTAVTFEECTFADCNFSETQFKRCTFRDCVFRNCDLSLLDVDYSTIQRSKFEQCKLIGVNGCRFVQTNLTKADFRGARNYAIAANQNTLKEAKFSLPEAVVLLHGLDIILEDLPA